MCSFITSKQLRNEADQLRSERDQCQDLVIQRMVDDLISKLQELMDDMNTTDLDPVALEPMVHEVVDGWLIQHVIKCDQ